MGEPLDLGPIEERDEALGNPPENLGGLRGTYTPAAEDRRALLAEVKRLRAERDEVRAAWKKWLTEPTDEESAKGEAVLDRLLGGAP